MTHLKTKARPNLKAQLIAKMLAEFLGTFAIVFFGCGLIAAANVYQNPAWLQSVPLVFGATVAFMIYAVGHISGAHFNPAVTLAFAVVKRFPRREVFAYWLAQFGGALAACGCVWLILPQTATLGATVPTLPVGSAVLAEGFFSFFLMFVIIAVATDSRATGTMAGLAIGLVVTVAADFGGPLTGASMNPARSLAPAFFEYRLADLWIYFVGPIGGSVLAALTYEFIRCENAAQKQAGGCC